LDTTFHPTLRYASAYLEAKKPQLVGIYFDTLMSRDAKVIARIAKGMGMIVVAGGPHASVYPESVIGDVDISVIGEGEEAMDELVEALPSGDLAPIRGIWYKKRDGGIRKNIPRDPLADLDTLDFPALDLVEMDQYMKHWYYLDSSEFGSRGIDVMASRGCDFGCTFCQPTLDRLFGPKVKYKSPAYLAGEIEYYMHRYQANNFFFRDDTFLRNREWSANFFDTLERKNINIRWGCNSRIDLIDEWLMRRMHRAGGRCIHLGIESGSQRVLDGIYKKGIKVDQAERAIAIAKNAGIRVLGFFMLGAPGETAQEINQTIKLAVFSRLDEATFAITTPLPATRLYETIKSDKHYLVSNDTGSFDYYNKLSYSGGGFTPGRIAYLQKKALFLFYLHPHRWQYLGRHFCSLKGLLRLYHKIRRFF